MWLRQKPVTWYMVNAAGQKYSLSAINEMTPMADWPKVSKKKGIKE